MQVNKLIRPVRRGAPCNRLIVLTEGISSKQHQLGDLTGKQYECKLFDINWFLVESLI